VIPLGTGDFRASLPAKVLTKMLRMALSVKPAEASSVGQVGALLEVAGGVAKLVATDGHRLAYLETMPATAGILGEHRLVVPWETVVVVERLFPRTDPDTAVVIARFDSDRNLQVGDRFLKAGSGVEGFPDYEPLFQEDRPHSVTIDCGELEAAIKNLSVSLETVIRLRLEPGQLRLMTPSGVEPVGLAIAYQGPSIETTLNSRYLVEALRVTGGNKITLRLGDGTGPIEISCNQDGTTQKFIIMPLRI